MLVQDVISWICALFTTQLTIALLCIAFLGFIGKSLHVRRAYLKVLLKIFEYGRQNIEDVRKLTQTQYNKNIPDANASLPINYDSIKKGDGIVSDRCANDTEIAATTISTESTAPAITEKTKATAANSDDDFDYQDRKSAGDNVSCQMQPLNSGYGGNEYSNSSSSNLLISRDALILVPEGGNYNASTLDTSTHNLNKTSDIENSDTESDQTFDFHLSNCLEYIKAGVEAIIEDEVTSRFEAEELKNWNLLTRTNRYYEFISWRLSVIWFIGFFIRYIVLMPCRVIICFVGVIWLTICTAAIGCIPDGETKRRLVHTVLIQCFNFLSSALSAVVNYHDVQNRPAKTGICVANHTSPIDVLVLMCDNCYSLIGQRHGGFLGVLQRALARASPHIWFERAESKDRLAVAQRLRQHVSDPLNPPILIFPEGTCINNTSVMQFKKGSFEVGGVIYPVAIK